jgi:hypothetical protein
VASVDLAAWLVAEAAGAYGDQVLADASPGPAGSQAARPRTRPADLRLPRCGCRPPGALAAVVDRPGRRDAGDALETWIGDLAGADPGLALRWPKCSAGITGSSLIAVTSGPCSASPPAIRAGHRGRGCSAPCWNTSSATMTAPGLCPHPGRSRGPLAAALVRWLPSQLAPRQTTVRTVLQRSSEPRVLGRSTPFLYYSARLESRGRTPWARRRRS